MELLRVRQVAEVMNVTVGAVYALVHAKAIPYRRVGLSNGAIRIDRSDLDAYLDACKVPAKQGENHEAPRRVRKFTGFKHLRNYCPPVPPSSLQA